MAYDRPIPHPLLITLLDDRARCRVCRLACFLFRSSSYPNPIPGPLHRDLALAGRRAVAAAAGGIVLLLGIGAVLGAFIGDLVRPFLGHNVADLVIIAALAFAAFAWHRLWMRLEVGPRYRRDHRRIALRHGCCPWCMYTLPAGPAHLDGCIVCPECGGAWRRCGVPRDLLGNAGKSTATQPSPEVRT